MWLFSSCSNRHDIVPKIIDHLSDRSLHWAFTKKHPTKHCLLTCLSLSLLIRPCRSIRQATRSERSRKRLNFVYHWDFQSENHTSSRIESLYSKIWIRWFLKHQKIDFYRNRRPHLMSFALFIWFKKNLWGSPSFKPPSDNGFQRSSARGGHHRRSDPVESLIIRLRDFDVHCFPMIRFTLHPVFRSSMGRYKPSGNGMCVNKISRASSTSSASLTMISISDMLLFFKHFDLVAEISMVLRKTIGWATLLPASFSWPLLMVQRCQRYQSLTLSHQWTPLIDCVYLTVASANGTSSHYVAHRKFLWTSLKFVMICIYNSPAKISSASVICFVKSFHPSGRHLVKGSLLRETRLCSSSTLQLPKKAAY